MKYVLKEMSKEELPREKLKKYGPSSLSDYELLAIILKTGTNGKSVIDLSIEVMSYFYSIDKLEEATINELMSIRGIGEAKALELLSSIELGKRLNKFKNNNIRVKSAKDIYEYIKADLANKKQENFACLYLDAKTRIISHKIISIGTVNETSADVKSAVKWGLKYSCSAIAFIHNHPSGDPSPSENDIYITKVFKRFCDNLDIIFLDHIIIGSNSYYSFKKNSIEYI